MGNESEGPAGLSVVVCLPGDTEVKHKMIDGDVLAGIQALVGGYVDKVGSLPYSDELVIDVLCNEEGTFYNEEGTFYPLPSNRLVYIPTRGQFPILGPIVCVGANPRTGDWVGLDEGMIAEAVECIRTWPMAPKSPPVFKATVIR